MPVQAAGIQARVTEVMRGALARAADPKEPMAPGDLLRLAATVRVLEALAPVRCKTSTIVEYIYWLVLHPVAAPVAPVACITV